MHASPLAELSDVGNALQKAGFALPATGATSRLFFRDARCVHYDDVRELLYTSFATDTDSIKIRFPDALAVMELLSASGESNAVRAPAFF